MSSLSLLISKPIMRMQGKIDYTYFVLLPKESEVFVSCNENEVHFLNKLGKRSVPASNHAFTFKRSYSEPMLSRGAFNLEGTFSSSRNFASLGSIENIFSSDQSLSIQKDFLNILARDSRKVIQNIIKGLSRPDESQNI